MDICTKINQDPINKSMRAKRQKVGLGLIELTTSKALGGWRGVIPSTSSEYASPYTRIKGLNLKPTLRKVQPIFLQMYRIVISEAFNMQEGCDSEQEHNSRANFN